MITNEHDHRRDPNAKPGRHSPLTKSEVKSGVSSGLKTRQILENIQRRFEQEKCDYPLPTMPQLNQLVQKERQRQIDEAESSDDDITTEQSSSSQPQPQPQSQQCEPQTQDRKSEFCLIS